WECGGNEMQNAECANEDRPRGAGRHLASAFYSSSRSCPNLAGRRDGSRTVGVDTAGGVAASDAGGHEGERGDSQKKTLHNRTPRPVLGVLGDVQIVSKRYAGNLARRWREDGGLIAVQGPECGKFGAKLLFRICKLIHFPRSDVA